MSTTLSSADSRKQREIREREGRILEVARQQLLCSGYLGLNMDRIAAEIEYSKGTIYQHFRNKEEILVALATQALETRLLMFRKAAAFEGPSRVRMATVGAAAEAFVEHFAHHFLVEQVVRVSSIWEKTSPDRRELMESCERDCMATTVAIVHDAVADGSLVLPAGHVPEELIFGMWALYQGAQTIAHTSHTLAEIGIADPIASLRFNQNRVLDGYGWRPLSADFDYYQHMNSIKQELFRHDQFA
ncbi:TetR/AcrR family transcriptional regulator [Botrimarina hoheduenensis]|uniref:Bacterial regulatory protein, tetR family n=1 Tax=Botrimarina hoheduenensis TaxID=2528000 RepID=A0A5C5WCL4_9BACT|nr:TetR/AcrR family transcriptional regulator [Botrimarina hoheduenensis]TWT47412.1 Bacterial regulatory protein, tetR family [Botrimarina hoheduenensis]